MRKVAYILIWVPSVIGCKKPYDPPLVTSHKSYLVVEGIINSGTDSTIIKLSRTVDISSKVTSNPVSNALLTVESDQNAVYQLTETTKGNYASPGLNLDISRKYRLRIKTDDNQVYLSDFAEVKVTPPIDSIGFNIITVPDTGIQIYANTHDTKNNTRYYRWDYDENWQFHAMYGSNYISNGFAIVLRQPSQDITVCYSADVSSNIVLASSARLKQDVIYQSPIVFIRSTSEKIEDRYTILVRQTALTGDAYSFWENLKKNTEQLGSIFDALPSEITGNIHCLTTPSQPVIGYVSVSTIQSKRIFIPGSELPAWIPAYPYSCAEDTDKYGRITIPLPNSNIPTGALGSAINPGPYLYSTVECVDCTIRGTVTPPPIFR